MRFFQTLVTKCSFSCQNFSETSMGPKSTKPFKSDSTDKPELTNMPPTPTMPDKFQKNSNWASNMISMLKMINVVIENMTDMITKITPEKPEKQEKPERQEKPEMSEMPDKFQKPVKSSMPAMPKIPMPGGNLEHFGMPSTVNSTLSATQTLLKFVKDYKKTKNGVLDYYDKDSKLHFTLVSIQ